jgi:GH24 family phage-related lysozyme (muramidase)
MYDSVRTSYISFTTRFEGSIPYMYLDIKGLVTIGIGNLIDPIGSALTLPFVRKSDGSSASQAEITAEWNKVKAATNLAQQGAKAAAAVTTLMLTPGSITALVLAKLDSNVATLKRTTAFAAFESWPADAQLGLLSMAWALGPSFAAGWPTFTAAVGRGDWPGAAANCQISTAGNPGVAPRNAADVQLFTNAAAVKTAGSDPSVLWYPKTAHSPGAGSSSAGTGSGTTGKPGTGAGTGTGPGGTGKPGTGAGGTSASAGTGGTNSDTSDSGMDDTGTDATGTDDTGTDGTEDTGTEDTGTEDTGTEDTGTEDTGTGGTGTGGTGTGGTGTEASDASGTDASGTDASGSDASGTDGSDTDATGTDASDTDGSAGGTDASDTGSDGADSDSGGADSDPASSTDSGSAADPADADSSDATTSA